MNVNDPTLSLYLGEGTAVMSQQQVADELGITKSAVFQVEKRALRKLRKILKRRLKGYFPEES